MILPETPQNETRVLPSRHAYRVGSFLFRCMIVLGQWSRRGTASRLEYFFQMKKERGGTHAHTHNAHTSYHPLFITHIVRMSKGSATIHPFNAVHQEGWIHCSCKMFHMTNMRGSDEKTMILMTHDISCSSTVMNSCISRGQSFEHSRSELVNCSECLVWKMSLVAFWRMGLRSPHDIW